MHSEGWIVMSLSWPGVTWFLMDFSNTQCRSRHFLNGIEWVGGSTWRAEVVKGKCIAVWSYVYELLYIAGVRWPPRCRWRSVWTKWEGIVWRASHPRVFAAWATKSHGLRRWFWSFSSSKTWIKAGVRRLICSLLRLFSFLACSD